MKLDPAELFDLHMRRQNKPPSTALPAENYRDPAQTFKFEREKVKKSKRGK